MHPKLIELPSWADPWPGNVIIENLPSEQYHACKSLVSNSALAIFGEQTPAHYIASIEAEDDRTEAMAIGSAFHVLVLEPDLFAKKVCVVPDFGDMRSPKNRAVRDAFIDDEAVGRETIKQVHHELIEKMATSVRQHPAARKLLRDIRAEVTAVWTDPSTGVRCKARADGLPRNIPVAIDIKSALTAAPRQFARAAADMRYHVQDALYSRIFDDCGAETQHFVFIVVEKEPPYAVACYQLDETARLKGEELYMRELERMAECRAKDIWPGYGDQVIDLRLPAYATVTESV